ncbi:MAG: SUMF1/EgtB/PvdO family nonheme iron enzyme [Porphyromonadaceae bacterium]|nr:SUMF1/EgtB/PvdO family nonheme iron enzyme [Porphyromonadaceae bacterium]
MKKKCFLVCFFTAIVTFGFLSCQQDRVTDILVEPTEKTLKEGEEFVIKVKITPDNAKNRSVTWQSDNTDVAKVDEKGKVTAIKEGTAVIKVKTQDGNKTAECKVIVSKSFDPNCVINGIKFEFVEIPGGTFTMGSPDNEPIRDKDEPQHSITLSSFYMGKYEVTQAQWKAVMGKDNNPSFFKGDNLPMEMVSWEDTQLFINKLNELTKKEYRLPTEAEWEYACRAGTTTPFYTGDNITTDQANYNGEGSYNNNPIGENRQKTTEVGTFSPNAWGLYDMSGNIWEWCNDWYDKFYYGISPESNPIGPETGTERVIRGGSWRNYAQYLRSANRSSDRVRGKGNDCGFRLVHPKK